MGCIAVWLGCVGVCGRQRVRAFGVACLVGFVASSFVWLFVVVSVLAGCFGFCRLAVNSVVIDVSYVFCGCV